ncbi:hypothetical protein MN0502_06640 [Arthrobacter sp. MN05-02]|nr:hypothetical protein MN0502_06640 [Arthrobacter sp. MN05-02]
MQPILDRAAQVGLAAGTASSEAATSCVTSCTDVLADLIQDIERAFQDPDTGQWTSAVQHLQEVAGEAGARRVEQTASRLLALDMHDAESALELLFHLRSDARVFTLAQAAERREQAFANQLTGRRIA